MTQIEELERELERLRENAMRKLPQAKSGHVTEGIESPVTTHPPDSE
jgi:hypothetical protein